MLIGKIVNWYVIEGKNVFQIKNKILCIYIWNRASLVYPKNVIFYTHCKLEQILVCHKEVEDFFDIVIDESD